MAREIAFRTFGDRTIMPDRSLPMKANVADDIVEQMAKKFSSNPRLYRVLKVSNFFGCFQYLKPRRS